MAEKYVPEIEVLVLRRGFRSRISRGRVRFSLSSFCHVFLIALADLLQPGLDAAALFVEFHLVGFPVRHIAEVSRSQVLTVCQSLKAMNLLIQVADLQISRVDASFVIVDFILHGSLTALLDNLRAFQRLFEGSQVTLNAIHFEGQLVAAVFQFLDSVHLDCLWVLRLIGMVVEWLARPVMSRRYLDQQARRQAALASPSSVPGTVFTT